MIKNVLINISIRKIIFLYSQMVQEVNFINCNKVKLTFLYKKIYNLKKIIFFFKLKSPEFFYWLKSADLLVLNFEKYEKNTREIFKFQNKLANHASFEIIEPSFVINTIGSSFTIDALIKAIQLEMYPKKELILPLTEKLKSKAQNLHILNYYKKYITIIDDEAKSKKILKDMRNYRSWHNVTINLINNFIPMSHPAAVFVQKEWIKKEKKPLFKLSEEDVIKGKGILKLMDLPQDSWYVVVHVRDSRFKGEEAFRDSNIEDYFDSFKFISDCGGWVIRMGDRKSPSLPQMKNVIDYSKSIYKSDFMDIFLCASAKFILGTPSGLSAISFIFGVPVAMSNYLPLCTIFLGKNDIFLPRLMRHIKTKEFLSFNELTSKPYTLGIADGMYKNLMEVEIVPNKPEEITELVTEMYNKINNTITYTDEEKKLQKKFSELTLKNNTLFGSSNLSVQCSIGNHFIKHYSHLLN